MDTAIYGKEKKKEGVVPAIILVNPKFPHNVGAAVRAASCFGISQVWYTGDRVAMELEKKRRLPREERMRGYKDVELRQFDYPFEVFKNAIPVAVELRPNSELLPQFIHPEQAVYVFGPEDGSIPQVHLRHCHRFVVIPTHHCVNLSAAVYMILYDRLVKRQVAELDPVLPMDDVLREQRGPVDKGGKLYGHGTESDVEI